MFSSLTQAIRARLFDRCVLRPSRTPMDFGEQIQQFIEVDGWRLETFFRSNASNAGVSDADLLVIKFPGTAGRAERSTPFPIPALDGLDLRINLWTWNPPGYGQSSGRASMQNLASASVSLCSELLNRCSSPTVWLCGNSLGCATAMNVAANLNFQCREVGLLLRNPPPLKPVFRRVAQGYPLGKLTFHWADSLISSMDVMQTAKQIKWPAVFLHSELDELVPLDMQQDVADGYRGQSYQVVLKGLAHGGGCLGRASPGYQRCNRLVMEGNDD